MKEDLLLHKWMQGTLSEEELTQFQARPEYESLRKIKENTDSWTPPPVDFEAMLQNILATEKGDNTQSARIISFNRTWVMAGIAAAILILFSVFFWPGAQNPTTYIAANGHGILQGTLPDGSEFALNAGSSLTVEEQDWKTERAVVLDGEAFFEVETGNTFSVTTANGVVTVLGTKFNVRDREEALEVTCQEGKVQVSNVDHELIKILTPGEGVSIDPSGGISEIVIENRQKPGWTNGISTFRDVPLNVVLAELERQFGITFESGSIDLQTRLSCNFQHEDLKFALQTSLLPLGIEYEINGSLVTLTEGAE